MPIAVTFEELDGAQVWAGRAASALASCVLRLMPLPGLMSGSAEPAVASAGDELLVGMTALAAALAERLDAEANALTRAREAYSSADDQTAASAGRCLVLGGVPGVTLTRLTGLAP